MTSKTLTIPAILPPSTPSSSSPTQPDKLRLPHHVQTIRQRGVSISHLSLPMTMPTRRFSSFTASPAITNINAMAIPHTSKTSKPCILSVSEAVYSFRLLEALRKGDAAALAPFLKNESARAGPVRELTSPLHLAMRCAEASTIQTIIQNKSIDINLVESQYGNTPLHLASLSGRPDVVQYLLSLDNIDDTIKNNDGLDAMEVSKTPEIAQLFQVSRAELNFTFLDLLERWEKETPGTSDEMLAFLNQGRIGVVDVNAKSRHTGSTLLHEAVRRKDPALVELAFRKGADIFVRNKRGKRVLETTKDEKIKALLQQLSNADAAMAANSSMQGLPPIFRGYLGKWTNFAGGYKTRWFVLENGILSYYHTQEEEGKQSRGSTNLRFAKIRADANDKHRFEVIADPPAGTNKAASRLYLKGGHPVERARWVQVLQQCVEFFELERSPSRAESIRSFGGGTRAPSVHNDYGTASVPAGSSTPFQVPSRTGTPFRGLSGPTTPGLAAPSIFGTTAISSSSSSKPPSVMHSRSSVSKMAAGKSPSIMTRDSRTPSDEIFDDHLVDQGHSLTNGPRGIPHGDDFPLVSNYLRTQMELSQQLAQQTTVGSSSAETQNALRDALQATQSFLLKYQEIVASREAYLIRRYEQEIQAKHLWEENIRTLAQQHAELELQLQEAAQENTKKRRAIKELRDTIGATPSNIGSPDLATAGVGAIAAGGVATIRAKKGDPLPTLNAAAMKLDDPDVKSAPPASLSSMSFDQGTEDADDEFFDAIESGNLPGLKIEDPIEKQRIVNGIAPVAITDSSVKAPPPSKATTPPISTSQQQVATSTVSTDKIKEYGVEPYHRLRKHMPIGKDDRPSVSLWGILKNNIGKDLTKISFPVSLNEPTSMLERMAEDMTYAHLLDTAARQKESTLRMAFVAAFACSNYVTTLGRVAKPFNPMLGETFEFINVEGTKYRYQSEQVSHHPPISACIAESLQEDGITPSHKWEYTGCVSAQSKFLGRSFEVRPTGWAHVKLKINGEIEHYSFKKVTTSISGFVTGSPTIDHYGDMNIKCHSTGDECTMTFKPRGWRSSGAHELKGTVISGKTNAQTWEIAGRWSSQMVARRVSGAANGPNLDPDGNVDSLISDPTATPAVNVPEMVLLWKYHQEPLQAFNLTPYAVLLNDLPDQLHDWLPPTDCRLRPDLRLFETGRYDEADVMKRNLEEYQRSTRKKREAGEVSSHKPKFFSKVLDADTQADYWQPHRMSSEMTPEYWVRRQKKQWDNVEKIFGNYTA